MPRLEIRVALGITVVAVVAWGLTRVPPLLAGMETFRVSETQVEGRRYLTQAQVVEIAGIPADASVWDDFDDWEDRLREHPVILEASVDRVLPGTLIVRIREREAVALVAMPTLEPVDREGRRLPRRPGSGVHGSADYSAGPRSHPAGSSAECCPAFALWRVPPSACRPRPPFGAAPRT